jgi:hypothetical protein
MAERVQVYEEFCSCAATEPGAVATGSKTQLEWQHPLATTRVSVTAELRLVG